jgi:hypothetical protein
MRFREKESACISRVSITCSGWERLECFLRRKNSATRRRTAAKKRAPRAMPTLAPAERPPEEREGEGVEETAIGPLLVEDAVVADMEVKLVDIILGVALGTVCPSTTLALFIGIGRTSEGCTGG